MEQFFPWLTGRWKRQVFAPVQSYNKQLTARFSRPDRIFQRPAKEQHRSWLFRHSFLLL